MTRPSKADGTPETPEPAPRTETATEAPVPALTPQAAATAPDAGDGPYEPYPGAQFFHGGRHSPIVAALARRLEQEGHVQPGQYLGADWTNGHRHAFASFQKELRPKEGGDVSGIPDQVAWDKLQVPRVSPRPERN